MDDDPFIRHTDLARAEEGAEKYLDENPHISPIEPTGGS